MKRLYIFILFFGWATIGFAQGEISGKVTDKVTGKEIPFANVVVLANDVQKDGAQTDFDGFYSIKPLSPGKYDVKVSSIGYNTAIFENVQVSANKITTINVKMESSITDIGKVVITKFRKPLIDDQEPGNTRTITNEEIDKMPGRSISNLAATSSATYQADDGGALSLKGARSSGTKYYVDDMPVFGTLGLPTNAIEELTVLTGGIPAKYGDATGGIVNMSTRGPSTRFEGGVELISSEMFDKYGYNVVNFSITGPIFRKQLSEKDAKKGKTKGDPLVSYRLTGELRRLKDSDPSSVGMWKIKDDILADLEQNPLRESSSSSGFEKNAEYITKDDLEHIKYKQNVASTSVRLAGALDFAINKNTYLTFSGNGYYGNGHNMVTVFSLFNPENNPRTITTSYRGLIKFTQKFAQEVDDDADKEKEDRSKSLLLKNAFYSIQISYQKQLSKYYDDDHKTDPFTYGHIGTFNTYRQPLYWATPQTHSDTLSNGSINSLTGVTFAQFYADTLVTYAPGVHNPGMSRYTEQYMELSQTNPTSLDQIFLEGGLRNGDLNENTRIYSLYYNTGIPYFYYGNSNSDNFRFQISGSVDLKKPGSKDRNKHALEFGLEYEQSTSRSYSVAPFGIWTTMRQLANRHIEQFDNENPLLFINGEVYSWQTPVLYNGKMTQVYWDGNTPCASCPSFGLSDTIFYNRKYVAKDQAYFSKSLRAKLGYAENGLDFIDIDALDPSSFSLDMFSADELIENGVVGGYYGFDYLGNKYKKQPTFDDYFTEKDENDNYSRPIAAFRPIYNAAYIQDKFVFKDLNFNIGLRIDRYDANQKVLKDKYSLYAIRSAGEVTSIDGNAVSHPSNIDDDFAVYVDDITNPKKVLGYRDEDVWYNAEGEVISDPEAIASATTTGNIAPYLVDPDNNIKDEDYDPSTSFKDYEPQISVMPRIAFTFPISDRAQFFAHYDELTQRPPSNVFTTPRSYYFLADAVGPTINNSDLKPEKTVDYQVGFEQVLSKASALSIAGFYREMRDMIQRVRVTQAYPVEYFTSDNIDFGTVKGIEITYDLRRLKGKNVRMVANYTLQFADGTGSSSTSQASLVSVGLPNLRTIMPLNIDQRHNISLSFDFSFSNDDDYNGPKWFGKDIFENSGVNIIFQAGSGTPYTRQTIATPEAQFGVAGRSALEGSLNGSRKPWRFDIDAKLNKSFKVQFGAKNSLGKRTGKVHFLTVYIEILNLLNSDNIQTVYAYTGNPDDDGYLDSPEGARLAELQIDPESFKDLYAIKVNNPNFYGIPRRTHLGIQFTF